VLHNIDEMLQEIENVYDEVTRQASEHINHKDIILTFGKSDLLTSFLKAAKEEGKTFEVLVCETAPLFSGHCTAKVLQEAGMQVSLTTDASVYALMSRVDKVIISSNAVLANGGIIGSSGAYQIALAAKVSFVIDLILFRNIQFQ